MKTLLVLLLSVSLFQLARAADQQAERVDGPNDALTTDELERRVLQHAKNCDYIRDHIITMNGKVQFKRVVEAHVRTERAKILKNNPQANVSEFVLPLEMNFSENTKNRMALLAIKTMNEYGDKDKLDFTSLGINFRWVQLANNTRVLKCTIYVKPEVFIAACR